MATWAVALPLYCCEPVFRMLRMLVRLLGWAQVCKREVLRTMAKALCRSLPEVLELAKVQ